MNHFDWMRESDTYPRIGATRYPNGEAVAPLSDSVADLHVEEHGWLPEVTPEQAARVLWFLFGIMAGATAVSAAIASAGAALSIAAVLTIVWLVAFFVWLVYS